MFDTMKRLFAPSLLAMILILHPGSATRAEDSVWTVSKSSGDVWLTSSGTQPVSLTDSATLKPGDNIRTGQNGRVLLARGEETILISPNSVIGIPKEEKEGLSTTILQQAGSILLEVEKRNENHFAVETPYLAAVVKGTQFRVSVSKYGSTVDVLRGKVEVADFKSGQHAFVLPGQTAKVSTQGRGGLSLNGPGSLSPIQQGKPRAPSVEPVSASKTALSLPGNTPNGGQVRISSPLGEVKLDVNKVTKGMVRSATVSTLGGNKQPTESVWNSRELTPGNGPAQGNSGGNSGGNAGNGNGGNGNAGNGNGWGNGNAFGHASCNPKSKGKSGC
jgi:hypothetical protein